MLVLSRKTNESVFIDSFEVKVGWIRFNKVQLLIKDSSDSELGKHILYDQQKIDLAAEIKVIIVLITDDKVRLGIEAPRGTHIERSEFQ